MRLNRVIVATALIGAVGLAGCTSTRKALGMTKVVPDEFRVVSKAPLVVPPDYALRPPAPGEPRPQELQPESAARTALLGKREAANRTPGEQLLVTKAGGDKSDPLIRFVVDDENGDIAHKDKSFADKIMFWKPGETRSVGGLASGDDTPAPVDAAAEDAKIKALTGDKPVIIAREKKTRLKLPGL
jgi:hypothetical protein